MNTIKRTFNFFIPAISLIVLLIISSGFNGHQNGSTNEPTALEETNKKFINTYTNNFWNKHNIDAFEKYFTSDFVVHFATGDQNYEQYKGICKAYFISFPDLIITTNELIAKGNKVVKLWTANSTHKAEFMGIPATGNKMAIKGMEIFRIEGGKIAELWVSMDNLGMMQQLGVIPPMGK